MKPTQLLSRQTVLKLVFESALIVFSVLLALFLNEYRGQLKENQQKELAMQMVTIELRANLETFKEWRPYHKEVLKNLNEALKSDSSKNTLYTENGLLRWSLMPSGVVHKLVDNASWQTLKASSVSSTIDFNTMFTLSKLYKLQAHGVESTLNNILTIISSRESLEKKNQRSTIMLLRNAFDQLVSQETFIISKYEQAFIEIGIQDGESKK